jgi:hypothetical protein
VRTEIRFAGFGGLGIISAGKIPGNDVIAGRLLRRERPTSLEAYPHQIVERNDFVNPLPKGAS